MQILFKSKIGSEVLGYLCTRTRFKFEHRWSKPWQSGPNPVNKNNYNCLFILLTFYWQVIIPTVRLLPFLLPQLHFHVHQKMNQVLHICCLLVLTWSHSLFHCGGWCLWLRSWSCLDWAFQPRSENFFSHHLTPTKQAYHTAFKNLKLPANQHLRDGDIGSNELNIHSFSEHCMVWPWGELFWHPLLGTPPDILPLWHCVNTLTH